MFVHGPFTFLYRVSRVTLNTNVPIIETFTNSIEKAKQQMETWKPTSDNIMVQLHNSEMDKPIVIFSWNKTEIKLEN